ncbi:ribbon-helix-helix protein, CopG family [Novosphingobium profundi]|uniref:ribbon-helix-helix domain-containing protein n=1 Tax=Novosphingobium profundi TaxID=1774954 RepID=UPI001BDA6892|nr:ribbon-helix-helix domain-containing protein [Novosphingobium profundi]MBT0671110.1 ribbon-helix-helix protein, CopG family [Novosphingobium profundi]
MEQNQSTQARSVRLSPGELKLIDQLAEQMETSRSEALRYAIRIGLPFALAQRGINVDRILMAIEILVTQTLWQIEEHEGAESVQRLLNASSQSVTKYHA